MSISEMHKKNKNISLEPSQYQEIYECWNGKGKSCITTRNIPKEKKDCALGNIIRSLDRKTLMSVVEPSKDQKKEEYKERKDFVDYIHKKYRYLLPFEKLEEEMIKDENK